MEVAFTWDESQQNLSFFNHGYVKRKATKEAQKLPPDFSDIKLGFLQRIKDEVVSNSIPLALVFNFDQTGSKLVPVCEWTMEKQGSRQVPVVGKEDKREITVLLTVTATGKLLPPQVIYQDTWLSSKSTLRLLLIAGTNFSEFSGNQQNH